MTDFEDVAWDPIKKRYSAYLYMHGDRQLLGYFQTPEDAYTGRTQSAWFYVNDFLHYANGAPPASERYPRCA